MRISVNQMTKIYGVHPGTQWLWRKDGKLPYFKGNKEISYDQDVVQKMALANELNTKAYNNALML